MANTVKIIKYEDLIDSVDKTIKELWKFIGLNTKNKIKKKNFVDSYGNMWFSNSSFHKNISSDSFDNHSAKKGWSKRLEPEEIMMTELVCGDLMEFFGYKKIYKKINIFKVLKLFKNNLKIKSYYNNWKNKKIGIEEFPANPLDKTTWE